MNINVILLAATLFLSACANGPVVHKELDLSKCQKVDDTHRQTDHGRKGQTLYRCADGKSLLLNYKA